MELAPEDLLWIQQFKAGHQKELVFGKLLQKYSRKVYWQVRRIVINHDDADDVVQNTFIKVWEKLDNFREDSLFYTWLYRIATNEALGFLQKKKANLNIPLETLQAQLSEQLVSANYFNGNRISLLLEQAVLTLPEKQRLVFNMKYFEHLKYEEISEILDTSVGALKASYHHAVKKIEEKMKLTLNH
ncbi:MAG: RNA polymerase sigma factor [Bacteroidota bacterium]|jgi:RNA polymerase sigma-70 factor (ECF subfamily)|nr:RNA polymerase sigma factor [Bacteroidota bacterium]